MTRLPQDCFSLPPVAGQASYSDYHRRCASNGALAIVGHHDIQVAVVIEISGGHSPEKSLVKMAPEF